MILNDNFIQFHNFARLLLQFSKFFIKILDFFKLCRISFFCEPDSIYQNETPIVAPVIKMLQLTVVQSY
jgi:hypothetical protein